MATLFDDDKAPADTVLDEVFSTTAPTDDKAELPFTLPDAQQIKDEINEASLRMSPPRYSWRAKPSEIGSDCLAKQWYGFRWARLDSYDGRLARLFKRGHKTEADLTTLLEAAGWEIMAIDPVTLKQFRVKDFGGHLSGYLDAYGRHPTHTNGVWVLLEYKTYNTKRFVALQSKGVAVSDVKYYGQIQLYMHYRNLRACLFLAINKNDDDIDVQIIPYSPTVSKDMLTRAETIINAEQRPARIAQQPTSFKCAGCIFKGPCHLGEPVDVNCRSCRHVQPIEGGKFRCRKWNATIPDETAILAACPQHSPIA